MPSRVIGYFGRKKDVLPEAIQKQIYTSVSLDFKYHKHIQSSSKNGLTFEFFLIADEENSSDLCLEVDNHSGDIIFISGNAPQKTLISWKEKTYNFLSSQRQVTSGVRFDASNSILQVYRDRFGSKTWYFQKIFDGYLFASEPKMLLGATTNRGEVNENSLSKFLALNYRMCFGRGHTFFKDIHELKIAHYFEIDATLNLQTKAYWTPPNHLFPSSTPNEEYESTFNQILDQSIRSCLEKSKNPLFFVSGGLDSPLIAARSKMLLNHKIDTCAAIFPNEPDYDEAKYVNSLASDISKHNHLVEADADSFLDTYFNSILKRHDQPLLSPTYVLTWQLLEFAKSHGYDSVFGGGGGDIISAGCLEYQPYILADYLMSDKKEFEIQMQAWSERVGPYLRYWPKDSISMQKLISKIVNPINPGEIFHNPDWITPDKILFGDKLNRLKLESTYNIPFQYQSYRQSRICDEIFHQAIATHFVEDLNAVSFNLKGFDPFWNLDLVEFGFSLPSKMILNDGWTKVLYRNASKGILVDALRLRADKTGLGVPTGIWMRKGRFKNATYEAISSNFIQESGFFNGKYILDCWEEHLRNEKDHSWLLWKVFAIANWATHWIR